MTEMTRYELFASYEAGRRTFINITFQEGIDLGGVDLRGCNFQDCGFIKANFIGANLIGVLFSDGGLNEVIFEGANLTKAGLEGGVVLNCNFRRANLEGAYFCKRSIYTADFEGANLRGVDLRYAIFSRVNMRSTCLEGIIANDESGFEDVDLTGATNFDINSISCCRITLPNGEILENNWDIYEWQ